MLADLGRYVARGEPVEVAAERLHHMLLLGVRLLLLFFQPRPLLGLVAKDGNRAAHRPDLVLPIHMPDDDLVVAPGQHAHLAVKLQQRVDDAALDDPVCHEQRAAGRQDADDQRDHEVARGALGQRRRLRRGRRHPLVVRPDHFPASSVISVSASVSRCMAAACWPARPSCTASSIVSNVARIRSRY